MYSKSLCPHLRPIWDHLITRLQVPSHLDSLHPSVLYYREAATVYFFPSTAPTHRFSFYVPLRSMLLFFFLRLDLLSSYSPSVAIFFRQILLPSFILLPSQWMFNCSNLINLPNVESYPSYSAFHSSCPPFYFLIFRTGRINNFRCNFASIWEKYIKME